MQRQIAWLFGLVLAAALGCSAPSLAQPVEPDDVIEWHVPNRFRLWDQAESGGSRMSLDALLTSTQNANSPEQLYPILARFLADQPELYTRSYWRDGEEIYDRTYVWARHYNIVASAAALGPQVCVWAVEGAAGQQQSAPCNQPVGFQIPADGSGTGSRQVTLLAVAADGRASQTVVRVRDRLIASIGDSFASGEGNPDRPTDLSLISETFESWDADWTDRWPGREAVIGRAGAAQWWDSRCHRSFMSQHLIAALRYAAAHPQEATTFVSYACSGAATFNGLLARQAQPPGYRDSRLAQELDYPQVEVLIANMCRNRSVNDSWEQYWVDRDWISAPTFACQRGESPRPIDMLLVSIGGNDVGFASVIQDALLPEQRDVGTIGRIPLRAIRRMGTLDPVEAQRRITDELPENYSRLRQRLAQVLSPSTQVFQTTYPDPLDAETGEVCGIADDSDLKQSHLHSDSLAAFSGFWPDRGVKAERRWRFVFEQSEGREIRERMVQPLNAAVRANAAAAGWTLVDGFESSFDRRGWCAFDSSVTDEALSLPNWNTAMQSWMPWRPAAWRPYAPRQRLFRTPNDAVLTQQPGNPRPTFGWFAWLFGNAMERQQDALMASTAGSFHPTFEAHTIIGWSLGEAMIDLDGSREQSGPIDGGSRAAE